MTATMRAGFPISWLHDLLIIRFMISANHDEHAKKTVMACRGFMISRFHDFSKAWCINPWMPWRTRDFWFHDVMISACHDAQHHDRHSTHGIHYFTISAKLCMKSWFQKSRRCNSMTGVVCTALSSVRCCKLHFFPLKVMPLSVVCFIVTPKNINPKP